MTSPLDETVETVAAVLERHPDYRVLRRFRPRLSYAAPAQPSLDGTHELRHGLYVDVESTGLDTEADEIIELAMVPFAYDPTTAAILDVEAPIAFFEQPKCPIPPEIIELTRITPDMVAGQRIDDTAVNAIARASSLVIAHHAEFDRKMLERRLPVFAKLPWACSQREVEWQKFGVHGGALQNILMSACGEFTEDAHRGGVDCQVGVHVLATAQFAGRTAFSYLLESARQPVYRILAWNTPIDTKDMLRARGYRAWYRGGRFQCWYTDLRDDGAGNLDAEMAWCRDEVEGDPNVTLIHAVDRYSARTS